MNRDNSISDVIHLVGNRSNFLLSGGAGSGKTYSLVKVVEQTLELFPGSNIACITYTNAAVREIQARINNRRLLVSTIHEFLWSQIKSYQFELKRELIKLINDPEVPSFKIPELPLVPPDYFNAFDDVIQYKEYTRLKKGIISHDELLTLASRMYQNYIKLSDITKSQYPFVFVDEYQDTNPLIVTILLDYMRKSKNIGTVGFFGDSMQSIYEGSVGNLNKFLQDDAPIITEVQRKQNRRNPLRVINLANLIRNDGLIQEPSDDSGAPNMESGTAKVGSAIFLYSNNNDSELAKRYLGWDFSNSVSVKELNLTHNLIAGKCGFDRIMDVYDRDQILDYVKRVRLFIRSKELAEEEFFETEFKTVTEELKDKFPLEVKKIAPTPGQKKYIEENPDSYLFVSKLKYSEAIKIFISKDQILDDNFDEETEGKALSTKLDRLNLHLGKIQHCIDMYLSKDFNRFLKSTSLKITCNDDKQKLSAAISEICGRNASITIGETINAAHMSGICIHDDGIRRFQKESPYTYERMQHIPFIEFQNLYQYRKGRTPFSTQHKTKGSEYPNVFVVLDNGRWSLYNFEYLFEGNAEKQSIIERTRKILYVCCTRAKENLAVYYPTPTAGVLSNAKQWFGEENVISLDG